MCVEYKKIFDKIDSKHRIYLWIRPQLNMEMIVYSG